MIRPLLIACCIGCLLSVWAPDCLAKNEKSGEGGETTKKSKGKTPADATTRPTAIAEDLKPKLNIHIDVEYGTDELQKLDAYLVKSDKPTPVLVEIHGGAFKAGGNLRQLVPGFELRIFRA